MSALMSVATLGIVVLFAVAVVVGRMEGRVNRDARQRIADKMEALIALERHLAEQREELLQLEEALAEECERHRESK